MSDTISKTSDATVPLSFSAAIDHLCEHIRQGIESCIPAQFIKYDDRDKNLAVVSPLVKFPYVSGNKTVWTERPQFTVRILRAKSGGFWLEMPLKEGDTGWIIAADRDTSFAISRNANVDESKNAKEYGGGPQEYSNFNKLKYSFGFFIPDGYCNLKVEEGHENSSFWAMLKKDGSGQTESYIELMDDGAIVLCPGGEDKIVLVKGNVKVENDVEIAGKLTAETGSGNPLESRDTETLVPMGDDTYSVWRGKIFRTEGEFGKPFRIKGGSIDGKLIEKVEYWPESGRGTWIKFYYTDGGTDQILAPEGPQGEPGPQGPQGPPGPPGQGGGGGTGMVTINQGSGITVIPNGTESSSFTISAHWV